MTGYKIYEIINIDANRGNDLNTDVQEKKCLTDDRRHMRIMCVGAGQYVEMPGLFHFRRTLPLLRCNQGVDRFFKGRIAVGISVPRTFSADSCFSCMRGMADAGYSPEEKMAGYLPVHLCHRHFYIRLFALDRCGYNALNGDLT